MGIGIDPMVDYVFKRLFGDPIHIVVLIHLLNAIFEGQFRIANVTIVTPFLEKDFEEDKLGVLDLRVRDTEGRTYNLEMQSTLQAGLTSRLAYYLSAMYCEQLREGEPYHQLSPAISVCFLNETMFPATRSFHTRFRLCSLEERIAGRYLKVIYVRDPSGDSVFVITAYELTGKPLKAYRRRRRRKRR